MMKILMNSSRPLRERASMVCLPPRGVVTTQAIGGPGLARDHKWEF